jgi:prepilin-type N-terminal cleavage/methylation domain-containing protein
MRTHLHHRPGFTLIELILALGLSAVLIALLASALGLGVSRAVGSREHVERARLIDGIVSLVRGDVHRAVIYDPQDTSTAMELAEASAGFDVDSIDEISSSGGQGGSGGNGGNGGESGGQGGSDAGGSAGSALDTSAEAVSLRQPLGVYGTLLELQIDVLREHSQYEVDSNGAIVAPTATSGITTVRYALGQGTTSIGESTSPRGGQLRSGLVRQEVSRDLLNWGTQTGTAAALVGTPQLVAPEVARLEFRYFDGVQLVETWDSQLLEGQMPMAIEFRMWLAEEETEDGEVVSASESLPYVVTIALPGTWNAADADVAGAATTNTESASGDAAGTTGAER